MIPAMVLLLAQVARGPVVRPNVNPCIAACQANPLFCPGAYPEGLNPCSGGIIGPFVGVQSGFSSRGLQQSPGPYLQTADYTRKVYVFFGPATDLQGNVLAEQPKLTMVYLQGEAFTPDHWETGGTVYTGEDLKHGGAW